MAGEKNYLRIPPDSTGKRIALDHTAQITYQSKSLTTNSLNHTWVTGKEYNIAGFGNITLLSVYQASADGGILTVEYSNTQINSNVTPAVSAAISDPTTGFVIASVSEVADIFVNATHIVGHNNPTYGVNIDQAGSMNVRFSEGQPQLDAWGKLRVSGATHLGGYVFSESSVLESNFSKIQIGGGYVSYDSARRSVRIGADNAAPTFVPGVQTRSDITSNTYHIYTPGAGHLFMNTVRVNDPTAINCIRRWGLYDQENGFHFGINASGQFGVTIRSSATGTAVDLNILQTDFNVDKLDGTGVSQKILNLENDNIFWIDVQWHGAGRVRFGTYFDGQRVVMHEYYHGNNYTYAMSQTTSLPVRYVCLGQSGITSNLYIETWTASVWSESPSSFGTNGGIRTYSRGEIPVTSNTADPGQLCFTISPPLIANGIINRKFYIPTNITAYAYDSTTGQDAIVELEVVLDPVTSGSVFTDILGTGLQVSTVGTVFGAGRTILKEMFKGDLHMDMTNMFDSYQYGAVKNYAQDGGTVQNNISALTNASPAVITTNDFFLNIKEPQAILAEFNTREYAGKYLLSGFTGTTGVNGQLVYAKLTSLTTAELYTNEALTTPFNTTASGTYTGTGGLIDGFKGGRFTIGVFAKTRTVLFPNCKLAITVYWKEVTQ